jgi:hypothetical protein
MQGAASVRDDARLVSARDETLAVAMMAPGRLGTQANAREGLVARDSD